ncbi:DUF3472 domain-containing protein [Alienimonas chondri]|uniref:Fibronectin type-III domain-containing protein n=1 Tax=Alienimonas chondri TaxID=2681879 RepID=A0ABX1VIQ5_9PLAN|nr:DUF3472 domain-containing protein [Alienimonas chondri]NNJ27720.1 hypothetical protein [Alienimonas chondri]
MIPRRLYAFEATIATLVALLFAPASLPAQGFGGEGYEALKPGIDPGAPAGRAVGERLELTANAAYCESPGTMKLRYDRARRSEKITAHAGFRTHIDGWSTDGSAAVWGVAFPHAGTVNATATLKIDRANAGRTVQVRLKRVSVANERTDVDAAEFITRATNGFAPQASVELNVPEPGFYEVHLAAGTSFEPAAEVGAIEGLLLKGEAVADATVMSIRSPGAGAVHGRLHSTAAPRGVRLAVVEVRIATPDQPGQYFPVTTPFGYFGSTWKNLENRFGGANFSLWSDGDAARAGEVSKLSRLLAYRADARYTVFGHEGIGVKPIGENPWAAMKPTRRQVMTVSKIPGPQFETYACHFLNLDTGEWELFGCGQSLKKPRRSDDLSVGHFMEVLYPSPHLRRESHVRGWMMTENGEWSQIDRLAHGAYRGAKDLSHRRHGVTDDGWFYLSTGGWFPNDVEKADVDLPDRFRLSADERPDYLQGAKLRSLLNLPIEVSAPSRVSVDGASATIQYRVEKGDLTGVGTLYYGPEDGATFPHDINDRGYPFVEQWKWADRIALEGVKIGRNEVTIDGLEPGTTYYFRLLLQGKVAQVWTPATETFTTR